MGKKKKVGELKGKEMVMDNYGYESQSRRKTEIQRYVVNKLGKLWEEQRFSAMDGRCREQLPRQSKRQKKKVFRAFK